MRTNRKLTALFAPHRERVPPAGAFLRPRAAPQLRRSAPALGVEQHRVAWTGQVPQDGRGQGHRGECLGEASGTAGWGLLGGDRLAKHDGV